MLVAENNEKSHTLMWVPHKGSNSSQEYGVCFKAEGRGEGCVISGYSDLATLYVMYCYFQQRFDSDWWYLARATMSA